MASIPRLWQSSGAPKLYPCWTTKIVRWILQHSRIRCTWCARFVSEQPLLHQNVVLPFTEVTEWSIWPRRCFYSGESQSEKRSGFDHTIRIETLEEQMKHLLNRKSAPGTATGRRKDTQEGSSEDSHDGKPAGKKGPHRKTDPNERTEVNPTPKRGTRQVYLGNQPNNF